MLKEFLEGSTSFESFVCENSDELIVVDVQPHDVGDAIKWDMNEFAEFVNSYERVLVFFNGTDLGYEGQREMEEAYRRWGISLRKTVFQEKTYGWFREYMDTGYDPQPLVNYMVQNDINDSREIDDEKIQEIMGREELPAGPIFMPAYPIVPTLSDWNGADLCGGGEQQCLNEMKILMDSINMDYSVVSRWVYCGF
jgi:hypothetical protein